MVRQWITRKTLWKVKALSRSVAGGGGSDNMEKLPHQRRNAKKTRVKTKSWAASYEEKWRHMPTKSEEKRVRRSLHRPMAIDGGEGKKLKMLSC